MKTKGRRQSSNMQDQRGPTAAYNRPSALKTAADNRKNQAFWEGKYATAGNGKMARDAGAGSIARAAAKDIKKSVLKEISSTVKKGKK